MAQPPVPHQSLSSPPSPRLNSWRCTNKSPWSRGCPFFFSTFFSFFSTTFPSCPLSSRALLLELHISTSDSLTQSFLPLLHLLILFRLFLLLLIILVFILLFLFHLFLKLHINLSDSETGDSAPFQRPNFFSKQFGSTNSQFAKAY